MEYLLLITATIAAGSLIYNVWLRGEVYSLNLRVKMWRDANDTTVAHFSQLSRENKDLKARLSNKNQYRVNGRFAKRPDPIVAEHKRANDAYKGEKK